MTEPAGPRDAVPRAPLSTKGVSVAPSPRKQGRFLIIEPPRMEDDDLSDSSSTRTSGSPPVVRAAPTLDCESSFSKALAVPSNATANATPKSTDAANGGRETRNAPNAAEELSYATLKVDSATTTTSTDDKVGFKVKNTEGPLFDPAMAAAMGWGDSDDSTESSNPSTSHESAATTPKTNPAAELLPPMSAHGSGQLPQQERERMRQEWLQNILAYKQEQERRLAENQRLLAERKRVLAQRSMSVASYSTASSSVISSRSHSQLHAQNTRLAAHTSPLGGSPGSNSSSSGEVPVVVESPKSTTSPRGGNKGTSSAINPNPNNNASTNATNGSNGSTATNGANGSTAYTTNSRSQSKTTNQHTHTVAASLPQRKISMESKTTASSSPPGSSPTLTTPLPTQSSSAAHIQVLDLASYQKRMSSDHQQQNQQNTQYQQNQQQVTSSAPTKYGQMPRHGVTFHVEGERKSAHRRSASDASIEARMQARRDSGPPPPRPTTVEGDSPAHSSQEEHHAIPNQQQHHHNHQHHQQQPTTTPTPTHHQHHPLKPSTQNDVDGPKIRGRSASVSKKIGIFFGKLFDGKTKEKGDVPERGSRKNAHKPLSSSNPALTAPTSATDTTLGLSMHSSSPSLMGNNTESLDNSTDAKQQRAVAPGSSSGAPGSTSSLNSSTSSDSIRQASSSTTDESPAQSKVRITTLDAATTTTAPLDASQSPPSASPAPFSQNTTHSYNPSSIDSLTSAPPGSGGKQARPKPPIPPKPTSLIRQAKTLRPSTTTRKEFGLEDES